MHLSKAIVSTLFLGLSAQSCIEASDSDREASRLYAGETTSEDDATNSSDSLEDLYQAAIKDAVFADSDEIDDDLIAVTTDDDRVVWTDAGDGARVAVVTWTSYPDSYPPGAEITNDWGDLWVTTSPELKMRMRDFGDAGSLRVAQLLGLPPDAKNSHFATLWARPKDMFRPSPDNEITDHTCTLTLPSDAEDWYVQWYEHNISAGYFPPSYPWTRLGYTFDWAPGADEEGLSEFVIKKGSSLIVDSLETTAEYLALATAYRQAV
jgi:hypothetical protein